jgi:hypothetical protein
MKQVFENYLIITIKRLLYPLFNNRGEVAVGDGDTLTDDDLKALDGNPTDDPGGDDTPTDPPSGDTPGDDGGDDTPGDDVPADDDVVDERDERIARLEQTIEELKKATDTPPATKTPPSTGDAPADKFDARVEYDDKNHPYHGKTFRQIYSIDPDAAFAIAPRLATDLHLKTALDEQMGKAKEDESVAQLRAEEAAFSDEYAKGEFEKPYAELAPEQRAAVDKISSQVQDWMLENRKYGITISEAYYLMDRAKLISKTASRAARKVIDDATRGGIRTVAGRDDSALKGGGGDMSKWTEAQMEEHLMGLDDNKFDSLMKDASPEVRKKFPGLPWKTT